MSLQREDTEPVGTGSHHRLAYRPAELAAMVGLSAKAIYRAIERGELAASRVAGGSRLLIPVGAAEEWLERNAVAPREHGSRPPSLRPRQRSLAAAMADFDRA